MVWSPCILTSGNASWVCALPAAGYWRGLLNVPCCLTTYWQGESPKSAPQASRCPETHEEECAVGCCQHRHRELEMQRHGRSLGCETRLTPATGRDPMAGRVWGQRELLERGGRTSICRRTCRMGEPSFGGKLWGRTSLPLSPQNTGVIFLLGWCPLATAFIQQLLPEGAFFVQAGECRKLAQVLPKDLSLFLLGCLAPFTELYSHLNLHKNSTRVQKIVLIYTLLI